MNKVVSLVISALVMGSGSSTVFAQQSAKAYNVDSLTAKFNASNGDKERALLVELITDHYFKIRNVDSLMKYGKLAIDAHTKVNNKLEIAKNQLMLSRAYLERGDAASSEQYLIPSADYFKDKKDLMRYARAKAIEGALLQHKLQYEASANVFNEVVDLYNTKGSNVEDYSAYAAYTGLFGTYTLSQQFERALKTSDKYFKFIQDKYPSEVGSAHLQLGNLYNFTLDWEKAAAEFTKARDFYAQQNNEAAVASINLQLGISLASNKKIDSATAILNKSKEYFKKVNYKAGESTALYALSALALERKNYTKATQLLQEAIATSPPNNPVANYYPYQQEKINLSMLMEDSVAVTNSADKKSQLKAAVIAFNKAHDDIASQKTGFVSPHETIETHAMLAKAYALLGNYEAAYQSYKLSTTMKDSMFGTTKMRHLSSIESEITLEREKAKIQFEEATKRLEIQKAMELEALHHEFERKQALAKTEAERKQLLFEEEVKRKAIEEEYALKREAATAKYEQEKALAKANEEKEKALSLAELRKSNNARNISLLSAGLLLASAGVFGYGYSQKRKDNRKIAEEKKRSDELLLNILPAEIADELKTNGHSVAQQHPEVSVLFTDFVNFTQTSEKLGVEELVNELNINFTAFDRIMEKHGLEKIKTIGDAYLAVSGLPVSNEKHAQNAVRAALEILTFVEKRKNEVPYGLDIRIGINSGALIAGIIGVKKFAYDIWGDTVNIAARMEQSGVPGKVNISETTYTLVKGEFACEYRGKIDAKNKGELDMYFVNNIAKN